MIISVTSLKGGVGKSTIAQNLAVCMAYNDYKVCIVDSDTNKSSLRWAGLRHENLPRIPVFGSEDGRVLTQTIRGLYDDYEVIIIDGTPSLNKVTSKILMLSDLVLIPIMPSGLDLWATEIFLERYQDAEEQKEEKIPAYFILNQFDTRFNLSKDMLEVLENSEIQPLKCSLKNRMVYREAVLEGKGVYECSNKKAKEEIIQLTNAVQETIGAISV